MASSKFLARSRRVGGGRGGGRSATLPGDVRPQL